ncbi:MAG: hypothetical protein JNM55_05080 [Anaerolineales bacterium]|nr:hypothetical protein [Anaerolineales bacterium]
MLVSAVLLAFSGLYYWLVKDHIDYAALLFAFSAGTHSVYLHSTKSDKSGS